MYKSVDIKNFIFFLNNNIYKYFFLKLLKIFIIKKVFFLNSFERSNLKLNFKYSFFIKRFFFFLRKFIINNYSFYYLHVNYFFVNFFFYKCVNCYYFYKLNCIFNKDGNFFFPKTPNQSIFLKNIFFFDYNFCIGPAGSGKTFITTLFCLNMIMNFKYKKILFFKNNIDINENVGFLPGTLYEKISPNLKFYYYFIFKYFGIDIVEKIIKNNIFEFCCFSHIKGRTFDNYLIILDEFQNANEKQFKNLLTRVGKKSKIIILGDASQIDFLKKSISCFKILNKFKNNSYFVFSFLNKKDIIRSAYIKDFI